MSDNYPIYPDFRRVSLEAKSIFDKFTSSFPPYSDFSLLSLLSWDAHDNNSYSILNGNLVIRIKDYLGTNYVCSVLGQSDMDDSIAILLGDYKKLVLVPETTIKSISDKNKFMLTEDRDSSDYIINTQNLINPAGSKLRAFRHHLKLFSSAFPGHRAKLLDFSDAHTLELITRLNNLWYKESSFDTDKINEQNKIFSNFLAYSTSFTCVHLGLFVDDELITYYSIELLKPPYALAHFGGITNTKFNNCVSMMQYKVCQYLAEKGYVFQNIEQDTGLPGLRQAKLSYNPEYFLSKYSVTAH